MNKSRIKYQTFSPEYWEGGRTKSLCQINHSSYRCINTCITLRKENHASGKVAMWMSTCASLLNLIVDIAIFYSVVLEVICQSLYKFTNMDENKSNMNGYPPPPHFKTEI